jgi:hypothetical protein
MSYFKDININGLVNPTSTSVTLTNATTAYKLPPSELANRKSIIIYNSSDTDCYIGDSTMTTVTKGILLPSGGVISIDAASNLYGICGATGKILITLELA